MKFIHYFLILITLFLAYSCQDDEFITISSATLSFSIDTIFFDTVFTTVGSTTKQLKVYNTHNEWIKISEIFMGGGDASFFRMAVDGEPTSRISNIEIAPDDSLYIFVEVTIDPNNSNSPLVVQDSIVFLTNGNRQDIDLVAWGQDVHILRGEMIGTQIWTSEKPYLIIDSVVIDSLSTLTIQAGAVIHFHKQSVMLVWGSLQVEGEPGNPVTFRGDRLDEAVSGLPYDKLPEQWWGLAFNYTSNNNNIRYAVIKNGIIGLAVTVGADVNIENTIIDNQAYAGIYAIGAGISAKNCLISNCGVYNIALTAGGAYEFLHCSIVNYFVFSNRQTPAVAITNYIEIDEQILYGDLEIAYFGNCIIYGTNSNEIGFGKIPDAEFNYVFDHCLVRLEDTSDMDIDENAFVDVIYNMDPKFKSTQLYAYNFELDTLSPAKDKGSLNITNLIPVLQTDIMGTSRLDDDGPDLGVYERVEETE